MDTPKNHENTSASGKVILLGEDDIDDQEILEEVFAKIDPNLCLQFMNNGKKLVSHLEIVRDEHLPCLIVLDYNMPGLNGAEILKKLYTNNRVRNVPKIIWSTSDAAAYRDVCMELGACDYLVKPSKINVLVDMARHMLSFCDG